MACTTTAVTEVIHKWCFFSSSVRGPRAREAFDKSMGSSLPLLGAYMGFGAGSAFRVGGRDREPSGMALFFTSWPDCLG